MQAKSSTVYVACVPHTPLVKMQEQQRQQNPDFWNIYDARVREFNEFNPELVIVFGADHYSNFHLGMMPSFLVGHKAEAIDDCGGVPGTLDVPTDLALDLSRFLIGSGFDVATSYAMKVDHGFSNVLHFFLQGDLTARPVIPIFINALADPRPLIGRCRALGELIGAWAGRTGKRVAFLASGGLSHSTGRYFPQYYNAPNEEIRTFIVHGGTESGLSDRKWHDDIADAMDVASTTLIGGFRPPSVKSDWDEDFLKRLASGDLAQFDDWDDNEVIRIGGEGAAEIRQWIAAVAAGQAAGGGRVTVDFYSHDTTFGVGAGIVHAPAEQVAEAA